jgi:hypothetical protein
MVLIKDLKYVLQSCECPLDLDSDARVSKIEGFLSIPRVEPCRELIVVVSCGPEGWEKTRAAIIAGISQVELTLSDF